MGGLRIFLLLTATFSCICINLVKGDYYTDESYEDGKTFFDYEHLWYDTIANESALADQLNNGQESGMDVPVSDKESNQIKPEVFPNNDDYVVPGQLDNDKLDSLFILDIEKHLQAEMGRMGDQLFLLHKLISSILGPQVTLNTHDNVNPNSIVVNVPLNQGGIGSYNPFSFGFGPFFNDYTDELDGSGDDAWNPWFEDGYDDEDTWDAWYEDVFGPAVEWSNLPSNYSNSTHDIQHVDGYVIAVNETINKQSGDDFNLFSHKQVVHVQPENILD